jgi:hypothetical protein
MREDLQSFGKLSINLYSCARKCSKFNIFRIKLQEDTVFAIIHITGKMWIHDKTSMWNLGKTKVILGLGVTSPAWTDVAVCTG